MMKTGVLKFLRPFFYIKNSNKSVCLSCSWNLVGFTVKKRVDLQNVASRVQRNQPTKTVGQEHHTCDISFSSGFYCQHLLACVAGAKRWVEGRGGVGKKRERENLFPSSPLLFRCLPRKPTAKKLPLLLTYHSISTTGRESLCSLLCALRRNIRYSSGEDPGMVDTVLVNMANSVSSGRWSEVRYLCKDKVQIGLIFIQKTSPFLIGLNLSVNYPITRWTNLEDIHERSNNRKCINWMTSMVNWFKNWEEWCHGQLWRWTKTDGMTIQTKPFWQASWRLSKLLFCSIFRGKNRDFLNFSYSSWLLKRWKVLAKPMTEQRRQ